MDELLKPIGRYFQINRKLQGMTCKYVSEATGIDRNVISKIEKGQAPISLERFIELCNFYELAPGVFLDAVLKEQETGVRDMSLLSAKLL